MDLAYPLLFPIFLEPQEVQGGNIFDIVETGSHDRLRRLMEESLGAVSKEAIASALRHQGITFEALLARSEKAKEQGDSSFFSASGERPRPPPAHVPSGSGSGKGVGGAGAAGGKVGGSGVPDGTDYTSTDGGESEVTSGGNTSLSTVKDCSWTCGSRGSGSSEADIYTTTAGGSDRDVKRKALPPLGPAVFSMGKNDGGSVVSVVTLAAAMAAGAAGDGAAVTSVDRELQFKINGFTNNRKVCPRKPSTSLGLVLTG